MTSITGTGGFGATMTGTEASTQRAASSQPAAAPANSASGDSVGTAAAIMMLLDSVKSNLSAASINTLTTAPNTTGILVDDSI